MAAISTDIPAPADAVEERADGVNANDYRRPSGVRGIYSRYGAHLGYTLAALAVFIGWLGRDNRHISAEYGLGYALGILGGLMMLVLLLYPVRKRLRVMRIFGPTRHWFRTHMILGVLGPLLILYHCNFQLGSLNSKVALYCTLLVAGSGLVGRYIYAKIHHGLYGRKSTLQELLKHVSMSRDSGAASFLPELLEQMAMFDRQVLVRPEGVLQSAVLPLKLAWQTRVGRLKLNAFIDRKLKLEASRSTVVAQHHARLRKSCRRSSMLDWNT